MNNKNYIEAFNNLARELANHPQIELLGYHTFGGLSLKEIEHLEATYNCELDDSIRAFYHQTNGLQLRWMLKSNAHYHPQKYPAFQRNTAPVSWFYAADFFVKEDACLLLLPLEDVLRKLVPPDIYQEDIVIKEKTYSNVDFFAQIRPFDAFSYYCNMAFFLQKGKGPLVLMGDEQGSCFVDSRWTNFETYIDFVLATKALCHRRKDFFGQIEGYKEAIIDRIPAQLKKQWSLEMFLLSKEFPLADQLGSSTQRIETQKMQQKALGSKALSVVEFETILLEHQCFLDSGGIGGEWQLIAIRGQALGIYKGKKYEKGKQAILDMAHLGEDLNLKKIALPYSSWCGVYAPLQDFTEADLTGSLLTDANLEVSVFEGANLENVDFSRSNLKGACFKNANLRGADFENCNLEGADFRGAILEGSQFKGAVLKNVVR